MSAIVSAAGTPRQITQKSTSLPRSLNELQQTARLALKLDGKLQFFNEGGEELKTERSLKETKDGQVIEVIATKRDAFRSSWQEPLQSTIQADFVDHSMHYEQAGPFYIEAMSVLTKDAMRGRFDGTTVYAQDFAAKIPSERTRPQVQPAYSRHFLQHSTHKPGVTTYSDQFRPRPKSSQQAQVDTTGIRSSTLTNLSKGHKLAAVTSYMSDFSGDIKCKANPRVKPAFTYNESTLTDATMAVPLEGETVYQAHYLQNKVSPTQSAKPESASLGRDLPLESATEYGEQYLLRKGLAPNIILRHVKS